MYITCLINISSWSLVNEKFLNLKFNVFIITGFICSTNYVKEVVLTNHSWISLTLQRDGDWSSVYSPKNGECAFPSNMGEVGQIVEEGFLL